MADPVRGTDSFGDAPVGIGHFDFDLSEVMYYLYLPVRIGDAYRACVCHPTSNAAVI